MDTARVYAWLRDRHLPGPENDFDTHVVASILSLAISEARAGRCAVTENLGLCGANLIDLVAPLFPHAVPALLELGWEIEPAASGDEDALRLLLSRHTSRGTLFELRLAAMIARQSMRPNHLWQDLGLRNRKELSSLMARHFESLAARNTGDMKWKKFLYRMICADDGFRLCMAPSCAECDDFDVCFGDESGESLMATHRRSADVSV